MSSFTIIHQLNVEQAQQLHVLFQNEWWSKGRSLDDVSTMLQHSDLVLGVCDDETGKLVGFSRVLTDQVFKAFIFDVIVNPEYRGAGIGKLLINAILGHPRILPVLHVELYCRQDMVPYYQQCGFTKELDDINLMRRVSKAKNE